MPQTSPTTYVSSPKAIFALTHPMSASWRLNKHYPDAWDDLISLEVGISRMLLEVETSSSDEIKVYDYGYKLFAQMYAAYDAKAMEEAELHYLANGLPLKTYLDTLDQGQDFSLPEVVILNPIPLERLSVSPTQPLLDEVIEGRVRYRHRIGEQVYDRQILLQQIQTVPELLQWTTRCREAISQYGRPPHKERW